MCIWYCRQRLRFDMNRFSCKQWFESRACRPIFSLTVGIIGVDEPIRSSHSTQLLAYLIEILFTKRLVWHVEIFYILVAFLGAYGHESICDWAFSHLCWFFITTLYFFRSVYDYFPIKRAIAIMQQNCQCSSNALWSNNLVWHSRFLRQSIHQRFGICYAESMIRQSLDRGFVSELPINSPIHSPIPCYIRKQIISIGFATQFYSKAKALLASTCTSSDSMRSCDSR